MGEYLVRTVLSSLLQWFFSKALIRSMTQDENVFPEPKQFRPERYLDDQGALRTLDRSEDPVAIAFGFGRR